MTFVDSFALLSCRLFSTFRSRTKFLCINIGKFHMDLQNEAKTMDMVSVPPIVATYRLALQTFDGKATADLPANINKLKKIMDRLRSEDLGLERRLCDPATWKNPSKAPCTYIQVFQNSCVNMSIFVLKPGFKMPLHDHPHMHGLLKVIYGAVNIRSFSEHPVTEKLSAIDIAIRAKHEATRLAHGTHVKRKFFAEVTQDRVCKENSETCVLTPTASNYHEIQALEMPAAFFDVLSPPYDTLIEGIGPRRCSYYKVSNKLSTNLVELTETVAPDCFFCDQSPYLGPKLT
ncbi:2-aminoethanethiol dioxygenase [Cydia fagiglandana]|uniref:2-aminoethanethiol dioxygenase n=1 Tax=Cydia fagiglandana TaxID=1458189 RepID=UPI002FEE2C29